MSDEQKLSLVQTRVPPGLLKWVERQAKQNGQSVAAWLRIVLADLSKSDAPGTKQLGDELRVIESRLRKINGKVASELADALDKLALYYGHKKS